jgi:hypothetical protein
MPTLNEPKAILDQLAEDVRTAWDIPQATTTFYGEPLTEDRRTPSIVLRVGEITGDFIGPRITRHDVNVQVFALFRRPTGPEGSVEADRLEKTSALVALVESQTHYAGVGHRPFMKSCSEAELVDGSRYFFAITFSMFLVRNLT